MRAIKKINNNVAVCLDGNGKELIAFGKGIGFPVMPYEITDLSTVDRTFYDVNRQYLAMINEIPADIIDYTSKILDHFRAELDYDLNPNIVFTLSDHIAFAIKRHRQGIYIKMPLAYELEQTYPKEVEIAVKILALVNKKFRVRLSKNEISGIAMNIINNRYDRQEEQSSPKEKVIGFDDILDDVVEIIEQCIGKQIQRKEFAFARFATHLQYLLERLWNTQMLDTDNQMVYAKISEEYPDISSCVDQISSYLERVTKNKLSEEEKLYLILHVNRLCEKEGL